MSRERDHLEPIRPFSAEHIDRPVKRLLLEMALDRSRQTIAPFAGVYRLGRHKYLHPVRRVEHSASHDLGNAHGGRIRGQADRHIAM